MATLRSLKIKTSSCKRIVKELHSYEKEVQREAAKTADMKDKGADPYDLKQQVLISVSLSVLFLWIPKPLMCPSFWVEAQVSLRELKIESLRLKIESFFGILGGLVCLTGKCVGGIEDDDS